MTTIKRARTTKKATIDPKETFIKTIKNTGYSCTEVDGRIIVEIKAPIYLTLTEIPENVTFRTPETIKYNTYIQLPYLKVLPKSTVFENNGDVYLNNNKKLIEIPKGFKGFKNNGNIQPEDVRLKKPVPVYYFSNFIYGFLTEASRDPKCKKITDYLFQKIYNQRVNPELLNATYIDGTIDKTEMITYLSTDKLYRQYLKYLKENEGNTVAPYNFVNWCNYNNPYTNAERSHLKIGRFLKKIMPEITDTEIENFVNKYKSMKTIEDYEFLIVRGNEIHKYYDRANQDCGSGTSLYGSCRNYTSKDDVKYKYCDFYATTPETCGLLILRYKGETKIRGRAFIWNTTDGKIYVDHPYTTTQAEYQMYQTYIKQNNCLSGYIKGITVKVNEACAKLVPRIPYLDSFTYDDKQHIVTRK